MPWKGGKRWDYSITYDEGCAALLEYALPIHRKYQIPGHVALVATEVGIPRRAKGSSYEGMMILSKEQVRDLAEEGWGVSCHSMTHCGCTMENADVEIVQARKKRSGNASRKGATSSSRLAILSLRAETSLLQ